jgi:hypothetical protein
MKELLDMYSNTLYLRKNSARRALPLHKQLKNLYRKNKGFQSQNRKLEEELHHFKDELAQMNLNILVQASIERDGPVVMKSTPAFKKSILARENHASMI